jgi:lysophospholipase L1-like esterase
MVYKSLCTACSSCPTMPTRCLLPGARRAAVLLALCGVLLGAGQGCSTLERPRSAGRTSAEREKVILPQDPDGKPGAARRNAFFDHWNEQIIREDVAVSTVFLGDSITEWWDLAVYFRPGDGLIENRGISGDQASRMLGRLQADVIQLRPRNVVILAGTNDVSKMVVAEQGDDAIIQEVSASVESLMKQTRAAGINTLVCSILPTNSAYMRHGMRSWLRARINERIKAACAAQGCVYVDYASAMSDANGDLRKDFSPDGVHPNAAGYRVMTSVLERAFRTQGWRW